MCVARIGRVVSVESGSALVEMSGQAIRALTVALPDVEPGEDVLVASGLIVSRLAPEEAELRRQFLAQMIALAAEERPT
jgi:hydrogenase maturation factor